VVVQRVRGRKFELPGVELLGIWIPSAAGRRGDGIEKRISIFRAFDCMGTTRKINFGVVAIPDHSAETVMNSWEPKTMGEIDWEITLVKASLRRLVVHVIVLLLPSATGT